MLDKNQQCCTCPEQLAMATVPLQELAELYDWQTALMEGTVFPELNLTFFKAPEGKSSLNPCGCSSNPAQKDRESLMNEINCISFAVNDLTLYLDTHPDCTKGASIFHELSQKRLDLLAQYAREYNPLTQSSMVTGGLNPDSYAWADGPMPWEGGSV